MSGEKFSADITAFVKKSKLSMDTAVRFIALDIFRRVVNRTPVDTGLLRSNWQASVGSAAQGRLPTRGKQQVMDDALVSLTGSRAENDIYLINNLPYAVVIEYGGYPNPVKRGTYVPAGKTKYGISGPGWVKRSEGGYSKQAPQGMVRISLRETLANIEAVVAQLK